MSLILKEKIKGPAVWRGSELACKRFWVYELSDSEIASLDKALTNLKKLGRSFPNFLKENFLIPEWANALNYIADRLENGLGFLVMRRLPVERYTEEDLKIIFYGLGLNLGIPVRQNYKGDMLGIVMNTGDLHNKNTRVYETNAYLPYHTDPSDVVGLLCVRKAKVGGISSLVSVAAVYNEILEKHPEYLGLFYRPWYYAHLGEDLPSLSPLFSFNKGKLSCRYLRQYIELGHEISKVPLSRIEIEALDLFDTIAHKQDLHLDMLLEPGDLQWVNNYAVMHARTVFEDDADAKLGRKKLRLWLKMPNARHLAPDFPGRNGFPLSGGLSIVS